MTTLREGTATEAGTDPVRVDRARQLARGWVEAGYTTALQIVVARRGIVVLDDALGRLTPETDGPALRRDHLYPLTSITKPIVATLAMQLVEDGLLGLNRPVQEYIPEVRGEGKAQVMVHHLLTHTSGLRDEDVKTHAESNGALVRFAPAPGAFRLAWDEIVRLGFDVPLRQAPGTEMSYSNYRVRSPWRNHPPREPAAPGRAGSGTCVRPLGHA